MALPLLCRNVYGIMTLLVAVQAAITALRA
jgi:hypothetical protein